MTPPGWFRLVRAGGFAAVCVVLSKAGHDLMASSAAPGWSGWVALAGVSALGYRLADRRRPLWWILLAVQVVQFCLHVWFSCCTPAGAHAPSSSPGLTAHGGMHHLVGTTVPMSHEGGTSPGMFGVHVLAGVVVAVWLHMGERALWRALGVMAGLLLGRRVRSFVRSLSGAAGRRRPPGAVHRVAGDETGPFQVTLRHAVVRRGPPHAAGAHAYFCT
jgi:hypothetical protein